MNGAATLRSISVPAYGRFSGTRSIAVRQLRDRQSTRYLFLNTRRRDFPAIGDGGQVRYATLHVQERVAHDMKRAPTLSADGSQAVLLKPLPTHQSFDTSSRADYLRRPVVPSDRPYLFDFY